MSEIIIHSDGAARGNPGPAGAGAVLTSSDGKVLSEICKYLGEMTNNQAEYEALLMALEKAVGLGATKLKIYADSELMVRQINGDYRVKNGSLKPLFEGAMKLLRKMGSYSIEYIPREKNKRADKLANLAIDGQLM